MSGIHTTGREGMKSKRQRDQTLLVRPFKGLGLPPQGTGGPWQGFEQGKDGVRFVLQQDPSGFFMEGK